MTQLRDTDKMPWGKYEGTPMCDVPADYLFWLWTNGGKAGPLEKRKDCQVADYIRRNLSALEQDYPDGIWR